MARGEAERASWSEADKLVMIAREGPDQGPTALRRVIASISRDRNPRAGKHEQRKIEMAELEHGCLLCGPVPVAIADRAHAKLLRPAIAYCEGPHTGEDLRSLACGSLDPGIEGPGNAEARCSQCPDRRR